MAWYYGTYSCGHEGRTNIVGPTKDRERKIEWHFSGLCPDCHKKKQEEERKSANKEAAKKSAEMELPELSGTEKQVAWANTLRIKAIDRINSRCAKMETALKEKGLDTIPGEGIGMKEVYDSVQFFIQSHSDARYWIEIRDEDVNLKNIVSEYKKYLDKSANSDAVEETTVEEESIIVSPCDTLKNGVAKIIFKDGFLCTEYVKDSEFMEIVKGLGYKWDGTAWRKEITEYTGSVENRAAELGNKLLSKGFTVQFPDKESKGKAISSDFIQENDRWVKFNTKTGTIAIVWKKRSDTLYEAAKKLPGAKWSNGSMKINVEFYKEVIDFAETMGFSISQKANEEIEKYKKKESGFERSIAIIPKTENISDEERIKKSLKTDGAIIEDLRDDD